MEVKSQNSNLNEDSIAKDTESNSLRLPKLNQEGPEEQKEIPPNISGNSPKNDRKHDSSG